MSIFCWHRWLLCVVLLFLSCAASFFLDKRCIFIELYNILHVADVHYEERKGLYIGKGTAAMSRSGIFRVPHGIAVEMTERVYKLPSFNGISAYFLHFSDNFQQRMYASISV